MGGEELYIGKDARAYSPALAGAMEKESAALDKADLKLALSRLLGIGWMITNGWSYVLLFVGFLASIDWMKAVSLGYLAILWIPFSPEKVVTVSIALFLVRRLFPKHNRELEAQIMEAVPPKSRKKPRRKKDSGEV